MCNIVSKNMQLWSHLNISLYKRFLWCNLTVDWIITLVHTFQYYINVTNNCYLVIVVFLSSSLKAPSIIWQRCGSHRGLPRPSYSKNVEPQWGLFDWTGIQMSAGRSLSISDFNRSICENAQWERGNAKAEVLSCQSSRAERRRCGGTVPVAQSFSDRCENSVGGELTLIASRLCPSARWGGDMPGKTNVKMPGHLPES